MFVKRWHFFKRDWRMWVLISIPALVAMLVLTFGAYKSAQLGYDVFNLRNITLPADD